MSYKRFRYHAVPEKKANASDSYGLAARICPCCGRIVERLKGVSAPVSEVPPQDPKPESPGETPEFASNQT